MINFRFSVHIGLRWWVEPMMYLARFNRAIGIPIDSDQLKQIISRHGIKITFKAE